MTASIVRAGDQLGCGFCFLKGGCQCGAAGQPLIKLIGKVEGNLVFHIACGGNHHINVGGQQVARLFLGRAAVEKDETQAPLAAQKCG